VIATASASGIVAKAAKMLTIEINCMTPRPICSLSRCVRNSRQPPFAASTMKQGISEKTQRRKMISPRG
jgi:hypothetical protein